MRRQRYRRRNATREISVSKYLCERRTWRVFSRVGEDLPFLLARQVRSTIQVQGLRMTSFDTPFAGSSRKHNFLVSYFPASTYTISLLPLTRPRSTSCARIFANFKLISSSIFRTYWILKLNKYKRNRASDYEFQSVFLLYSVCSLCAQLNIWCDVKLNFSPCRLIWIFWINVHHQFSIKSSLYPRSVAEVIIRYPDKAQFLSIFF